jgi:hypothetical protein
LALDPGAGAALAKEGKQLRKTVPSEVVLDASVLSGNARLLGKLSN